MKGSLIKLVGNSQIAPKDLRMKEQNGIEVAF